MSNMNQKNETELTFLQDPTSDRLQQAAAWNHHQWMVLQAYAANGEVHQANGVTWTYAGTKGEAMILFPQLTAANANQQLDAIVQYYCDRRPEKLVGCWSLEPPQPKDLGIRLLARGFQLGWQPRWMWLDLQKIITDHPKPAGLKVELVEDEAVWDIDSLPYYDHDTEAIRHAVTRLNPQRVWHFAAWLGPVPVGHSVLCLTTGPLGVAGIYDVGVVPEARNQGIGKAVTLAACLQAQAMGCDHVLLNGTGEHMYRQLGFENIGYGLTWWLNVPRLLANPPSPTRVAFAEAVGGGDLEALDSLGKQLTASDFEAPLTNGMRLMQLAVHAGQPASAAWLLAHGATLDVLSAWDLGWKERAQQLLAENPELVNKRLDQMQTTLLHQASERNDIELALVVLAHNPDLEVKDAVFQSTPLGWAKHFQRTEIVELLEQHQASRSKP